MKKLFEKTTPPAVGRPTDPLQGEMWGGIHGGRLEQLFHDSQSQPFSEQVRVGVESAVTELMNDRRGKCMYLCGEEIARVALEKLNGAETVRLVKSFGDRARQFSIAIRNSVVFAAASLYEKQFPPERAHNSRAG